MLFKNIATATAFLPILISAQNVGGFDETVATTTANTAVASQATASQATANNASEEQTTTRDITAVAVTTAQEHETQSTAVQSEAETQATIVTVNSDALSNSANTANAQSTTVWWTPESAESNTATSTAITSSNAVQSLVNSGTTTLAGASQSTTVWWTPSSTVWWTADTTTQWWTPSTSIAAASAQLTTTTDSAGSTTVSTLGTTISTEEKVVTSVYSYTSGSSSGELTTVYTTDEVYTITNYTNSTNGAAGLNDASSRYSKMVLPAVAFAGAALLVL